MPAVFAALTDGRRRLIRGRSAANLFGRHRRSVRTEIGRRLVERDFHPVGLALWGDALPRVGPSAPRRPTRRRARSAERWRRLVAAPLRRPWDVPLETWGWCLKRGLVWDYRSEEWTAQLDRRTADR
jgi:hypothetical protein